MNKINVAIGSFMLAVVASTVLIALKHEDADRTEWDGKQCLSLVDENPDTMEFAGMTEGKPYIVQSWTKSGAHVFELGVNAKEKKGYFYTRLCVVDGKTVRMPNMLQQSSWQR